ETLEDAIRRIDRETRQLLQDTYDSVNGHFGVLFPQLFGGGEARLILTGDEILDAGVQVMAQPPGKRNSSIHQLSGGEKALTAIALVFALFQLNPAPFCLLDEVDAPLDEPNTERYVEIVRQMSDQTQFLFITHNKIAMELASQLIGVTMQERGVSRIVAVDLDRAVEYAEVACGPRARIGLKECAREQSWAEPADPRAGRRRGCPLVQLLAGRHVPAPPPRVPRAGAPAAPGAPLRPGRA